MAQVKVTVTAEAGNLSGRMEKQKDVLVAQQQKRKGMSWSKAGSLSLALVTAHLPSLADVRTAYLQ